MVSLVIGGKRGKMNSIYIYIVLYTSNKSDTFDLK